MWLRDAKRKAKEVGGSESNFLFNAKNQITLWGPHGEINDYSTRQWNGLVGDYHYHRWTEYLKAVEQCVVENRTLSLGDYHERMMTYGLKWDQDDAASYPSHIVGNFVEEGLNLQRKYLRNNAKSYKKQSETSAKEEDIYYTSMSRNPRTIDGNLPCRSAGVSLQRGSLVRRLYQRGSAVPQSLSPLQERRP